MRISLARLAAIAFAITLSTGLSGQTTPAVPKTPAKPNASVTPMAASTHAQVSAEATNPLADPKAVVTVGNARFTVLTPELIRMEWAADGKFEDHASFVFLNRRLPVPKFEVQGEKPGAAQPTVIKTSALDLDV